jgi:predicted phosphodiesterase
MKVALVADTHFGERGDSPACQEFMARFFTEQFFPELKRRGIKDIIHLGDLVHRRKYINWSTAKVLRECFLEPVQKYNLVIIAGNHDVYFRDTNKVNALREVPFVEGDYISDIVDEEPYEEKYDGKHVLFVPWMTTDNSEACIKAIKTTKATVVVGHFDIVGCSFNRHTINEKGLDPKEFDRFEAVFSGHYHHKSSKGNIHYLGAPYEMSWEDYKDPRGFHIWDTETGELEYIQNPLTMYAKAHFGDGAKPVDIESLKGKIVKVIVHGNPDQEELTRFVSSVEKVGVIGDPVVVDDHLNKDALSVADVVEDAEIGSTMEVLTGYVDRLDITEGERKNVKILLTELYREAVSAEA